MNKGEQVLESFWDSLNKMMWLNQCKMKNRLKDYKPSEVHCIDYIGRNIDSNVTRLAESFRMTTGGITKITKKLIDKGLVVSYQKPDNKKEIYFRLTGPGDEIYKVHDQLHKEFVERDREVFSKITDKELDSMLSFAELYSRHLDEEIKKIGMDVTAGGCDKF